MVGYEEEENCIQDFGGGTRKERDHLQDLGVDKWILLKCIVKKYDGGVVWVYQASDFCERGHELLFPYNGDNILAI